MAVADGTRAKPRDEDASKVSLLATTGDPTESRGDSAHGAPDPRRYPAVPQPAKRWLFVAWSFFAMTAASGAAASWFARWTGTALVVAAAAGILGVLAYSTAAMRTLRWVEDEGRESSAYAPYVFGFGLLMLVVGAGGIVGLAGLIQSGELVPTGVEFDRGDAMRRARLVMLSGALGFIGAVFFVAYSLWRRMRSDLDSSEFDWGRLHAGTALRAGEAVLFVLVLVLFVFTQGIQLEAWLPITSLVLGMFVKSGERIVFGIAQRVLAAVEGIVPVKADAGTTPLGDDTRRERDGQ